MRFWKNKEKIEEEREKTIKRVESCTHKDHKPPVTRRDFLAKGFVGVAAGLSTFYWNSPAFKLMAQECGGDAPLPNMIPMLTIELAGGAPLAGQDLVVGTDGNQLNIFSNYDSRYGIPSNKHFSVLEPDSSLGLSFHQESPLLYGINSSLPSAAKNSVDGFVTASMLIDDSSENPVNPSHLTQLFQGVGTYNIHILGNRVGSPSGGFHKLAVGSRKKEFDALSLASPQAIQNVFGNPQLGEFSSTGKSKIIETMQKVTNAYFNDIGDNLLDPQQKQLLQCKYAQARELLTSDQIDFFPTTGGGGSMQSADPTVQQAFGDDDVSSQAIVAYALKNGFAGTGTLAFGGYDSHDGSNATTRERMQEAGRIIGQVLHYFHLSNKAIMINIITDGAMAVGDNIDSSTGYRIWPADSPSTCSAVCLAYVPGKNRGDIIATNSGRQIGSYTETGIDRDYDSVVATNPSYLPHLLLYNWLALHGPGYTGQMRDIVGDIPAGIFEQQPEKYKIFKKVT